jgi:hypothetical protein
VPMPTGAPLRPNFTDAPSQRRPGAPHSGRLCHALAWIFVVPKECRRDNVNGRPLSVNGREALNVSNLVAAAASCRAPALERPLSSPCIVVRYSPHLRAMLWTRCARSQWRATGSRLQRSSLLYIRRGQHNYADRAHRGYDRSPHLRLSFTCLDHALQSRSYVVGEDRLRRAVDELTSAHLSLELLSLWILVSTLPATAPAFGFQASRHGVRVHLHTDGDR